MLGGGREGLVPFVLVPLVFGELPFVAGEVELGDVERGVLKEDDGGE